MLYLAAKALLSGILIAVASEVARRSPGWGALIVSLPLVSLLSFIWLWRDTHDPERIAALSTGAFWFFLPSIPMFLVIPVLLRSGVGFVTTMAIACAMTIILYAAMNWLAPRVGIAL